MKPWSAAASLLALSVATSSAVACPFCESETGRQVQAGIFDEQFWGNVLLTLLPFPVLLVVVALIYFDLSWLWKRRQPRGGPLGSPAPPPSPETEAWPRRPAAP